MNPAVTMEQEVMEKNPVAEAVDEGGSDIQKFYRGTTVLVTGGTGFVGKLLIEKLLRSCPDIHRLYLLVRPKRNKSISTRLQEQFNDVLYDTLRKEKPDFIKKIAVIEGEMGAMDLGISLDDRTKIIKEDITKEVTLRCSVEHRWNIGDYPNTYAYTKAAAEDIVKKYSKGLPVAVYRPSILISTAKEPVAGWIDNVYGPTGVFVGAGIGLIHVLKCNPSAVADLVPGDMVINACIATAWNTAKKYHENHEGAPYSDLPPPVYNFVSSEQRPLTWKNFMKYNETYGCEVPSPLAIYIYLLYLTPSKFKYNLYRLFLHWIPAYIVDGIAVLIGKEPMLRKAYGKISKFSAVISYFATREWKFHNDNVKNLYTELCDADKQIFDFDLSRLDWSDYFYSYVRGVRVYLAKDPLDTVPAGIKKQYKLKCIHYFLCLILLSLSLWLFWSVLGLVVDF